jgi:peptidylprolyl isomerase
LQQLLDQSPKSDWRAIDPDNTLYMELPAGRVIIELVPAFAPNHVKNIKALVREAYFDGAVIVRSQDNYVVQWGFPDDAPRAIKQAQKTLKAEFDGPIGRPIPFTALADPDTYAPQVGFSLGFPVARNPELGKSWLVHCYAMVGAGRDTDADSGNGDELYAVNGQSPRNLDRNVTLVGRVIQGMDLLSVMPRGRGDLGFYQHAEERTPIKSVTLASDLAPAARVALEALRTDSQTFAAVVEGRRNRKDAWYKVSAGRVGVCNVPLPVRAPAEPPTH